MEPRKAVGWLAAAVVMLGIVLAIWPVHIASGEVGCGSALRVSTSDAEDAEIHEAVGDIFRGGDGSDDGGFVEQCQDRVATQRMLAFPVVLIGALVGGFLLLTAKQPTAVQAGAPENDEEAPSHP